MSLSLLTPAAGGGLHRPPVPVPHRQAGPRLGDQPGVLDTVQHSILQSYLTQEPPKTKEGEDEKEEEGEEEEGDKKEVTNLKIYVYQVQREVLNT